MGFLRKDFLIWVSLTPLVLHIFPWPSLLISWASLPLHVPQALLGTWLGENMNPLMAPVKMFLETQLASGPAGAWLSLQVEFLPH